MPPKFPEHFASSPCHLARFGPGAPGDRVALIRNRPSATRSADAAVESSVRGPKLTSHVSLASMGVEAGAAPVSTAPRRLSQLATLITLALVALAVVLGAAALWVLVALPIKTAGVHGMLPAGLHSWLAGGALILAAGVVAAAALVATTARRRSLVGDLTAFFSGVVLLRFGVNIPIFLGHPTFVGACTTVAALVGAALFGLAVAVRLEAWGVTRAPWAWLKKPLLPAALAIGAASLVTAYDYTIGERFLGAKFRREDRKRATQDAEKKRAAAAVQAKYSACAETEQLAQYRGPATALGLSPDARWLATLGQELIVWNADTGQAVWRVGGQKAASYLGTLLVSADGNHVLRFEPHSDLIWFDAAAADARVLSEHGSLEPLHADAAARSPDGKRVALVGKQHLYVMSLDNPSSITVLGPGCSEGRVAFAADGKSLWLACAPDLTRFDLVSHRPMSTLSAEPETAQASKSCFPNWYLALDVSTDGKSVLAVEKVSIGCVLKEWSGAGGKRQQSTPIACPQSQGALWSKPFLITRDLVGTSYTFYDLARHATAPQTLPGVDERRLAIARDGSVMYFGQADADVLAPTPTVYRFHPVSAR